VLNRLIEGRNKSGVVFVLLAALAGCATTPPAPSATSGQPVAIADASECRRLIESANLADANTIQPIDACRYNAAGGQAARAVLSTAGATPDQLWAAVWVYAASGTDPAPLVAILSNADPTLRAMASATLVGFGERSGLAPLAALLPESAALRGSLPPMSIGGYATSVLARYVSATDIPAPDADPAVTASAWQKWLASNMASLEFSATDGVWVVP
jgi:hypothetical protein